MVNKRKEYEYLDIIGIHYFTGTQKRQTKTIEKELYHIDEFIKKIKAETGHTIEHFEYGPGIGVAYFEGKDVPVHENEGLKNFRKSYQTFPLRDRLPLKWDELLVQPVVYILHRYVTKRQIWILTIV